RRPSYPAIAIQVLLEVVRRPDEIVVEIQLVGLPAKSTHPLEARQELRLETVLCPLHLTRRRSLVGKLLHFFVDDPMQLGEIVPGPRRAASGGAMSPAIATVALLGV